MGRLSVHHQQKKKSPRSRQATRKKQPQQKQIRVVYISNPMKVKIDASRFKGLVQELTGQHSDLSRFAAEEEENAAAGESTQLYSNVTADQVSGSTTDGDTAGSSGPGDVDQADLLSRDHPYNDMFGFEMLDDDLTPMVLENLAAFMPSSLCCDLPPPPPPSPPVVDSFRSLDAA